MSPLRAGLFTLVGLSVALSWWFARRGPVGAEPYQQCLTHADCKSDERCVIIPKNDGFATFGRCGEACRADEDCGNGWVCREWAAEKNFFTVPKADAPASPREKACVHHLAQ